MQCYICDRTFSKLSNLIRHQEKVHKLVEDKQSRPNEIDLQFESMTDFLQWKSKMEEETLSFYRNVRHVNLKNEKYHYYECSRSGTYKPKGKGVRRIKFQNSAKIGKKCPARINLKMTDSSIFVKFFKEHEGHGKDLKHLRLPSTFRAAVASKLKEGVSAKRVVEDARSETIKENKIGRVALLNMQDIRNIKRDFNVEHQEHKVDAVSVELWADEMAGEENNQVIHYKQQGQDKSGLPVENSVALIMCDMANVSKDNDENASRGNTLKEEEILATIQCLPEMGRPTFKNNKTSLIKKLHTLTDMYSSSSITKEEDDDLHKFVDRWLAVFSKRCPKEVVGTNVKKIERQCSLFSTKKKCKNNKRTKNSTWRKTKSIKEHLLQDCVKPINIHTEFDHIY